jgi:RimJ/RimL family protein N-acetyltransferase
LLFSDDFLPQLTKRLVLRRFIDSDLEQFLAYRRDPQVARFQSWSVLSESDAKSFICEMQIAEIGEPGEWFQIAIAHRQSNLLIGDLGIQVDATEPKTVEIGYTLSGAEQGKGYAKEAVKTLVKVLFESEAIHKVVAITDARNERSIRLLQALDMRLSRSEEVQFKGEYCTEQTFELEYKN